MEALSDNEIVTSVTQRLRCDGVLAGFDAGSPGRGFILSLVIMACIVSSGCRAARAIEHRVLYAPDTYPQRWWQPVEGELVGLSFEDVDFQSADGTTLNGWYVQPESENPTEVVVYAHGRNANISITKRFLFEFIHRHQVAVFVFDYRGYGKSEGRPTEQGIYQDVRAARDWACARTGRDSSEIVLMGRSLGAAAVIELASQEPPKALVIESAFTSTAGVVQHYTKNMLSGKRLNASYDSLSKIGNYPGPVFIGHGKYDETIPCTHGARLADAAGSATRVEFTTFNGGHMTSGSEDYTSSLNEFFKSL